MKGMWLAKGSAWPGLRLLRPAQSSGIGNGRRLDVVEKGIRPTRFSEGLGPAGASYWLA